MMRAAIQMARAAIQMARWVPGAAVFVGALVCYGIEELMRALGQWLDELCRRIVGMGGRR